jgi:hypothetical protein
MEEDEHCTDAPGNGDVFRDGIQRRPTCTGYRNSYGFIQGVRSRRVARLLKMAPNRSGSIRFVNVLPNFPEQLTR